LVYMTDLDLFFKYDEGDIRGHSKTGQKTKSRLDIGKYMFGNRIIDKMNSVLECCVKCTTLNNSKSHVQSETQPETGNPRKKYR